MAGAYESYKKIPAPEETFNGMVGKWSPSRSNPDNSSWIEKPLNPKDVDPAFGVEVPKSKTKPKTSAGDNSNVNKTYGPIAGSAKPTPKQKPKPKQDITKIPGFKSGRGTE